MRVLMLMIMLVIVRIRYFGLLLRSLICVCHLSRGQIHAFQETSVSAAPHAMRYQCGYASLLLYEASVERVKPRAVPHSSSESGIPLKTILRASIQCSLQMPRIGRTQ